MGNSKLYVFQKIENEKEEGEKCYPEQKHTVSYENEEQLGV